MADKKKKEKDTLGRKLKRAKKRNESAQNDVWDVVDKYQKQRFKKQQR